MNSQDLTQTVRSISLAQNASRAENLIITIFDGNNHPVSYCLESFKKRNIFFGRDSQCDIVLKSKLVSHVHGRFSLKNGQWIIEDKILYQNSGSTNGLIYNDKMIYSKILNDGDFIRIDDGIEAVSEGVLFVFSNIEDDNKWKSIEINKKNEIIIGRDKTCDIILGHNSVSKYHAKIFRENNDYFIIDNNSTNGILVNNIRILGKQRLYEKDVIIITNSKLIFSSQMISYHSFKNGISIDVNSVLITRGRAKKRFIAGNNISLNIRPGELVAIIGGSGDGKSTILNCMSGYLPPNMGDIYLNGINLYQNFHVLKKIIGYVPQVDVLYENLTLYDMLLYTAKLRLPKDITKKEREQTIKRVISSVELEEKKNNFIKSLSGGQRKRASIAVELLADPNVLFLDEPFSGLDPGTEKNIMYSLRKMADSGKTVVLVTHSILQIKLFDKIVVMGKGGNLCFSGSYEEVLDFFSITDIIDIYDLISETPEKWKKIYNESKKNEDREKQRVVSKVTIKPISFRKKEKSPLLVLCLRYVKIIKNDRMRFFLILLQAPVLSLLISSVADGQQFVQYEISKGILFALACSAFWIGMLNSIREICKEKIAIKREYMAGLSLSCYIYSKILVLGLLCVIQSLLMVSFFSVVIGLPKSGILFNPFWELLFTTILTSIASASMGLFVSSLFNNADRAMTVAPILLMPQILFSGLVFKLNGLTEIISWFAICRWSMEGYGTSANLNSLSLKLQQQGLDIPHQEEAFFEFSSSHMIKAWIILMIFILAFIC